MSSVRRASFARPLLFPRVGSAVPIAAGLLAAVAVPSAVLHAQSGASAGPDAAKAPPAVAMVTAPAASAVPVPSAPAPAPGGTATPPKKNLPPFVAPFLVTGKGVTIVEFAMRQTDVRTTRRQDVGHFTYRYGVAPRVELRAVVKPYSVVETGAASQEGFNGFEVGTRIQLIKQARGYFNPIPRLALQLGTTVPTSMDRGTAPTMMLPSAGLATNWRLGPADVLIGGATLGSAAVRGERRAVQNGFLVHFHHFTPDVMLSTDWLWRTQPDAAMLHHGRIGLIYALGTTVQLEARYVHGLNGIANDRGVMAGFAVRP